MKNDTIQNYEYVIINVKDINYKVPKLYHETIDYTLSQIGIMCAQESITYNEDLFTLIRIAIMNDHQLDNEYISPYLVRSFSSLLTDALKNILEKTTDEHALRWCNALIKDIKVEING